MRNYYGPTFGEKTSCFICDFWWLILILLILLISGGLLVNHFAPQLFPTPTPTATPTPQPTATPTEPPLGTGDIQVTLRWDDLNDLDLWVVDPSGEQIYYAHPYSASGGVLDVDANRGCGANITTNAVENIYWPEGQSPSGDFVVYVNLYTTCGNSASSSDYTVTVLQEGVEKTFTGTVSPSNQNVRIVEFSVD